MMAHFPHQHIKIPANRQQLRFKKGGRNTFKRRTDLSREQHAARLQQQIETVSDQFEEEREKRSDQAGGDDFGLILNIESAPDFPLKLDSLEKAPSKNKDGIYLLNVRKKETPEGRVTLAAILVPCGQLQTLSKKIFAYADPNKDRTDKEGSKSPRNADLLTNIERIGVAALEGLWTEPESLPTEDEPLWWELWISRAPRAERKDRSWVDLFEETTQSLKLEVNRFRLRLPDHEIVLTRARRSDLEGSLDLLNTLTEVRMVRPCSIDLSELPGPEQNEWIAEAQERIRFPSPNAPAVCLLDTGVNRAHPLLANLLAEDDMETVIPQFGTADHSNPRNAHGTSMAGMAAYDDLRNLMLSSESGEQEHRLESVKLIHEGDEHDHKGDEDDSQNYGAATREGVARPEVSNPQRKRVYCLALTQAGFPAEGQPSSWSAAIDGSVAGTGEEGSPKRVFFVGAGNHRDFLNYRYLKTNKDSAVENPAQAWNGIAVGAMTRRCEITEEDDESRHSRAVATFEGLSPFSRTSVPWNVHWPINPDIVMEGGNLAKNQSGDYMERESLEPISTASNFQTGRPLCNMNATSAATASAARLGAMLVERFPDYWPETHRGLMVHAARWRAPMLGAIDPHRPSNSGAVQKLLRLYGYGEPDQARLFGSGESGTTMIIQDQIQPYDPESKPGKANLGYFNLHSLPWPKDVFDQHRDIELSLRVTLSYFIDPNPGSRCWDRSQKYRYASHLLRFSFKRPTEDDEAFRRSLEKRVEEEEGAIDSRTPSDPRWALGPQLRGKSGSLVQDIWKGSPAELAEMGKVAVYPAKGWFATRSFPKDHEFHNCHQKTVRYSLIVSIDAEQDIGLYTAISNRVSIEV